VTGHSRGRVRLAVKIILAAAAAATSTCLLAIGVDLWDPSRTIRTGLVATTGAVAFTSSVHAAVEEYRRRITAAAREKVAFVLRALAFDLQDATGIDVRELGVSAYVRRRSRWCPWREELVRLHRERAVWCRATAGIRWRPGKGVVGRCVAQSKDVAVDLAALDMSLGAVTREQWPSVDPKLRLGLSWREYERVRDKYGVVFASPIIDDRGPHAMVVGCVAVDAPAGSRKKITRDEVRERVATAGTAILRLVL
jgi:hypothetical protein